MPPSQRERQSLVSLAIGPCGCGYGIECENGETGQATVARWKSEGATVERVPIEEAKERCVLNCPHEPRYGLLPTSEARAEALRLRVENERLRETLKTIGPVFPSHHIDGEKGGRWIEYGDGDGYWDDGDVHTEDCPACALGRRIDEALGV